MNETIALSLRNVSKRYMLYQRPQDRLKHSLFRHFGKVYGREFWAIKSVSFDIRQGEMVGIIGRNGSGKSTLLQMIAGTIQPTEGTIEVRGRIGALLELGSGFNPEYSGRQNIHMSGILLGIQPEMLKRQMDQIIDFADIGEFIDQPVKLYSSGMFLRLAFAITTSMDPHILLIDEALAVGDVFFRQKCYKRLSDLREQGVTVILVSHALPDVEQFCQRVLLIDRGILLYSGETNVGIKKFYLCQQMKYDKSSHQDIFEKHNSDLYPKDNSMAFSVLKDYRSDIQADAYFDIKYIIQETNNWAICTAIALLDGNMKSRRIFEQGHEAIFFFEFLLSHDIEIPNGGIVIINDKNIPVHGKGTLLYGTEVPSFIPKGSRIQFLQTISLDLAAGEYVFEIGFNSLSKADYERKSLFDYDTLSSKLIRLCLIPNVGPFTVIYPKVGKPIKLLHHGISNLPGKSSIQVLRND